MVEMEEGGRGGSKVRKPLEGKPLTHWQETSMLKMAAAGFTTQTTLPHEQKKEERNYHTDNFTTRAATHISIQIAAAEMCFGQTI